VHAACSICGFLTPHVYRACVPHLQVPEVPLVVSDAAESITKTSKALELLKSLGAAADAEKSKDSKALRRCVADRNMLSCS
jgi:hypothetical protein